MTESQTQSPARTTANNNKQTVPQIGIEIVSEEEMALIEAAFAATRFSLSSSSSSSAISAVSSSSSSLFSSISSTQFQRNARSIQSITRLTKRRLSGGGKEGCLSLTSPERNGVKNKWSSFYSLAGQQITKAMKVGKARHAVLEEEIVKRVKVRVESDEDVWASKFINFIVGANQLLLDGLTRELPLIGFTDGVWLVGVVDEIRMAVTEMERNPTLVETKNSFASYSSCRATTKNWKASTNVLQKSGSTPLIQGFPAKTLDDLVRYFRNTWCMLPPAHDQLLLRYELQEDHSLLGEDQFAYDYDWLKGQIRCSLELWLGEREANYTAEGGALEIFFPSLRFSSSLAPHILKTGDILRQTRIFSSLDTLEYSKLSHDSNPLHFDTKCAQNAGFEDRVVHGMLVAALFPRIISSHFPGAVYVSQSLHFRSPVYIGDKIVGEVQVINVRENKERYIAKLSTKCFKNGDHLVLNGEATAILPTLTVEQMQSMG
ncbi:hypothetical protein F0562_002115 [Nyssa sinensis]|uniref:MaoC-like domain-containing protein n=1 Tax=Nyssa sinensis TaxID=561372 RepID=A0A5J5CA04_9ASTE|nr:hypothetical protein F0562_002115 [Nyssa sinensis]